LDSLSGVDGQGNTLDAVVGELEPVHTGLGGDGVRALDSVDEFWS
jgi:hypothetical protein